MQKLLISIVCIAIITVITCFFGCASNSAFVDALPTEKNVNTYTTGFSVRGKFSAFDAGVAFENSDLSILPIDIIGDFPITDGASILLKYTAPVTISFGVKDCFDTIKTKKNYSAVGLHIGVDFISLLLKDSSQTALYFDLRIPFYQTLRINKIFAISAIPTLMIRNDYRHFQFLAGGNTNLRIGNRFRVYLEFSAFYNARYHEPEYQFGLAFSFQKQVRDTLQYRQP